MMGYHVRVLGVVPGASAYDYEVEMGGDCRDEEIIAVITPPSFTGNANKPMTITVLTRKWTGPTS